MTIVKVGDQRVKFPDSMSQEDIAAVLQQQFQQPAAQTVDLASLDPVLERMHSGSRSSTPAGVVAKKYQELLQRGAPAHIAREQALFGFESAGGALSQLGRGIAGAPEAALSVASGAIAEPVAGLAGLGASVNPFADPGAGARTVERVGEGLTFQPRSEPGKVALQEVGEAVGTFTDPISRVVERAGEAALEKTGSPLAATALETTLAAIPEIVGGRLGASASKRVAQSAERQASSLFGAQQGFKTADQSFGASKTPKDLERAAVAGSLPIPFEGGSALTQGQVTRNFEQLQFEKEIAKQGDLGAPLRDRLANQARTIEANLDALADRSNPISFELRDIGMGIDQALVRRADVLKRGVDKKYQAARRAGELDSPVSIDSLPDALVDIRRFEGVAPNAKAIANEAQRLGVVSKVDNIFEPNKIKINDAELFRQFVNDSTDITDGRQARIRRIVISSIDDSLDGATGELYKDARRARSAMARELENTGLTKRLMASKKGTSERSIAYEDVFKKVFLDSPIDEINKLRGTLLRSGQQGKQAWGDLKAKGIDYIKESSLSKSQMDEAGNAILSPERLNRVVESLDKGGKLDKIYGKRGAQAVRDLADLSKDILTAPPGSVNFSNTASALQVALDSLGTFALTGVPAPSISVLKEGAKRVRDVKKRARVNRSLNYLQEGNK